MKNFMFFGVIFIWCAVMAGIVTPQAAAQEPDRDAARKTADETPQPAASEISHEMLLQKLEKRYNAADFSADFFQESTLKAMDITDTASGKVWFKHPGMMRWEYETPENYAIISDGTTLWIYRPEDNQVVIGDAMTYFSNGKGASFLSNFSLIQDAYAVSLAEPATQNTENQNTANQDGYTLKLVPIQKQLDLAAIFLNIDNPSLDITSVRTLNDYEDETRILFKNLRFEALDAGLFKFNIPPGADILKLDE